jgi:hypothetical protein
MTLAFVTVCEAEADFRTASGLADRVVCEGVDWITVDVLDDYRQWRGLDDTQPFLRWRDIHRLARAAGFRILGHFLEDQPGEPDARAARRALWLVESHEGQVDGVLLIRDDDRQINRRDGLEQARAESPLSCPIVIGLAHLKRECWVMAGFDPVTSDEEVRLSSLVDELGFDPRTEAHRLTARGDGESRSANRVLWLLTAEVAEREADCWLCAPLATLQARGQQTGLVAYLEEVKAQLVPLFTGHSPA